MTGKLTVADEAWIATALLHREHPDREDFTKKEIVQRAERIADPAPLRPGVGHHISSHAVAQKPPQPGKHCLLFETALDGDVCSGPATRAIRTVAAGAFPREIGSRWRIVP